MTQRRSAHRPFRRTWDFDLHGIVGVRLLDATARDIATVTRQLGPLPNRLEREPDVTVRFVDKATTKPLTYVGMGDAGFNEDGFFLLKGKGGVTAKTLLPFDAVGDGIEIVCERANPAVPHLLTVMNLTALANNVLPLHASAFMLGSDSVLVTGWSKGGKTETLLACMSEGARYVGDEWVFITAQGQMYGLPEPMRLWAWQLEQLPELLAGRTRRERARLSTWSTLAAGAGAASSARLPLTGLARKAAPVLQRQAYLQVPPEDLFGADRLDLHADLGSVVLVMSHESGDITVTPAGPTEVPDRMAASLAEERTAFLAHYRQFRFAFPERVSELVEHATEHEDRLLSLLFHQRRAMKVAHPYPCDIAALGRAVRTAAEELSRPAREPDQQRRRHLRAAEEAS